MANEHASGYHLAAARVPAASSLIRPVLERAPRSAAAEAFRSLRTALDFLDPATTQAFAVTSPGPGEGKSTCAAYLAIALAQVGRRVLLVDADMRRPSLHQCFATGQAVGLSQLLTAKSIEAQPTRSGIEGLSVIPSGVIPPNPSEILAGTALSRQLEGWRSDFQHVVFDTPPLLAVTDALVLARQVDGVILVARVGATRDRSLQRSIALLREAEVRLLGSVVNDISPAAGSEYGYGYYREQS